MVIYLVLGILAYLLMDGLYILKNGKAAYIANIKADMDGLIIPPNLKPLFYCTLIIVTPLYMVFWVPIVLYKLSALIVEGKVT